MQPAASEISTCPGCGRMLEETSDGGLGCMLCLLRVGIGGEDDTSQAALGGSTSHVFGVDERFGVYHIERRPDGSFYELGHGAMGVTYRAVDTTLQRKVALKIIRVGAATGNTEARERFLREARAAAALRHEHIATVFVSQRSGRARFAQETFASFGVSCGGSDSYDFQRHLTLKRCVDGAIGNAHPSMPQLVKASVLATFNLVNPKTPRS